MAVVKFLLIVIAVVYAIRLVGRWLLGSWIRRVQKEYGAAPQGRPRERAMREGEVRVSGQPASGGKRVNDKIGDYVDYEEVS